MYPVIVKCSSYNLTITSCYYLMSYRAHAHSYAVMELCTVVLLSTGRSQSFLFFWFSVCVLLYLQLVALIMLLITILVINILYCSYNDSIGCVSLEVIESSLSCMLLDHLVTLTLITEALACKLSIDLS